MTLTSLTLNQILSHWNSEYIPLKFIPKEIKYLIINYIPLLNSKILNSIEISKFVSKLSNKLQINSNLISFELIYRGSENGFGETMFHKYCNNKFPTISIIKSNYNHIFGGYTTINWNSNGMNEDKNAFIYLIRANDKILDEYNFKQSDLPIIFTSNYSTPMIYSYSSSGPGYGGGNDIVLDEYNEKSNIWYGYTYFPTDFGFNELNIEESDSIDNDESKLISGSKEEYGTYSCIDVEIFEIIT